MGGDWEEGGGRVGRGEGWGRGGGVWGGGGVKNCEHHSVYLFRMGGLWAEDVAKGVEKEDRVMPYVRLKRRNVSQRYNFFCRLCKVSAVSTLITPFCRWCLELFRCLVSVLFSADGETVIIQMRVFCCVCVRVCVCVCACMRAFVRGACACISFILFYYVVINLFLAKIVICLNIFLDVYVLR